MATKVYLVKGPGEVEWSVWDHGDELSVCEGPKLTDRLVARVPQSIARKMTDSHRLLHVHDACGAIHVAKLLNSDSPNFHMLWQS